MKKETGYIIAFAVVALLLLGGFIFLSTPRMTQNEGWEVYRGNHDFKKEAYTDAEVHYWKGIDKNPTSFDAHYNLGNSLLRQEKMEDAASHFADNTRRIARKSHLRDYTKEEKMQQAYNYHNLGNSFYLLQQYDKAVAAYSEALRYHPEDNDTRYNLIKAMEKLQAGEGQSQDNENNNDNQEQQQQQQEQQQDQQDQQQGQQQQQEQDMSQEQAEQILQALQQDEQETQEKAQRQKQSKFRTDKDW